MARKTRFLTEHEKKLWGKYSKTIQPIHKHKAEKPQKSKPQHHHKVTAITHHAPVVHPSKPKAPSHENPFDPEFYGGLSANNYRKLTRGGFPIEARLDLHGHKQHEAMDTLTTFIKSNHSKGKRCVIVITGKGRLTGSGVLRQKVPEWLAGGHLKQLVLAITTAKPKDGGEGALYVLLRRKKAKP